MGVMRQDMQCNERMCLLVNGRFGIVPIDYSARAIPP